LILQFRKIKVIYTLISAWK